MTLAPYDLEPIASQRGQDVELLYRELGFLITGFVTGQERSQQTRIGPSELGNPCDFCLGCKLAGIPELPEVAWLAYIGTCVHAELGQQFTELNDHRGVRWLVEQTVSVGEVDGVDITGHADLFDRATATVIDWKVVGATTLKKAKKGPKETYHKQAHLYGRGFARRGLEVDRVCIIYLPRNSMSLADAVQWSEPYDEAVALKALARADALAKAIRLAGWENVWPGLQRMPDCENCHRYPNPDGTRVARAGRKADDFSDILAVSA